MANTHDGFSASVTVEGSQATAALSSLSARAAGANRSLADLGKGGSASTAKLNSSLRGTGIAAAGLSGGLGAASGKLNQFGLAAGTLAGVGLAVGSALGAASGAASQLNEVTNAAKLTFGEAAGSIEDFAETADTDLGLSKRAALDAATGFGVLLRAVGFSTDASAGFSKSLVRLSSDLASTFGGSVEDAALALRALFRGEGDPIEKYGVKVQELDTKEQALRLNLQGTNGELSQQDKTMARLTLVFQQTTKAQGDFSRTQADLANQQRIFAAQTENAKASLGGLINPTINAALTGLNVGLAGASSGAEKLGANSSDVVKGLAGMVPVIGPAFIGLNLLGESSKKSGSQFRDLNDALVVQAQEFNAGRASGKLYNDAITYLKDESGKAERSQKALAAAMIDEAQAATLARQRTDEARSSLQGIVSANRGAEDATLRVTTSRRALADAERSLSELTRKGKVDMEAVAQATERLADASQRVVDADRRAADARDELNKLLAKGKVDIKALERAEIELADARRDVAAADRDVAEAEKALNDLRAGPTGREAVDADTAVKRARLAKEEAEERLNDARKALAKARGKDRADAEREVESAQLDVIDATNALSDAVKEQTELSNRGKEGSEELADAERAVEDARLAASEATRRRGEAEEAERRARAGDPDYEKDIAAKRRDVAAADRDARSARTDLSKAQAEERKARAGDPDYERNVAELTERVAQARRDVNRALQDVPIALANARSKQDEYNAAIADGNTLLAEQARLLGIVVGSNLHLELPAQIGDAARGAYDQVRLNNRASASSATPVVIYTTLEMDGRRMGEAMAVHQERSTQNGGPRRGR